MERIKYFKPVAKAINLTATINGPTVLSRVLRSILCQWEYKVDILNRVLMDSDVSEEDISVISGVAENFYISMNAIFALSLGNPDNAEEWVLQLVSAADCLSAYHELVTHSCGKYEIHKALTKPYLLAVCVHPCTENESGVYNYITAMINDIFLEQRVVYASDLWNHV